MFEIYLLALQGLFREVKRFHDIFDVLLTHFSHIDHPVQKRIDAFLVLLENICYFDHVVALVEAGIVQNEAKKVHELLTAFGILEMIGLKLNLHNFADIVSNDCLCP